MRLSSALGLLLGAGCATIPAAPPPSAPGSDCAHRVCVHATLVDGESPRLKVRLTIPDAALPATTSTASQAVQFPFWAESFRSAPGYAAFVTQDGAPFAETVRRTPTGRQLDYEVALDHATKGPRHGLDEVPHRTRSGWFLVGRAFIPLLKFDGVVQHDLPVELHLHTGSLSVATLAGGAIEGARLGTLKTLVHALYYVGPHQEIVVRHGQTTVQILSSDFTQDQLQPLAQLVRKTLSAAERALGPAPRRTRMLVYDALPVGFAGGVLGDDITLMSSTPPDASGLSPMGAVVVHELSHLWLTADAPWLSEGFNTYLEMLFGLQLDGASSEHVASALLRLHSKFQAQTVAGEPVIKAQGLTAYSAGAVAAFCLDVELKKHNSSVVSTLRAALTGDGSGTTVDRYSAAVRAVSLEAAETLTHLVSQTEPIDLGGCLQEAGFELTSTTYTGYTLGALVVEVLKITGFSPQRAEVFSVKEDSLFQIGDIIRSVNGEAIELVPQIDHAIARAQPNTPVPVVLERAGATLTRELLVPQLDSGAHQSRQHLELHFSPSAAAALLQGMDQTRQGATKSSPDSRGPDLPSQTPRTEPTKSAPSRT